MPRPLHRVAAIVVACLVCLLAKPVVAAPISVAVEFGGLGDATFELVDGVALEQAAVVRLVQEGFAVVGRGSTPELQVVVTDAAGLLRIEVRAAGQVADATLAFAGTPPAELRLEVAQRIVQLVRTVRSRLPAPAPAPVSLPVEPPPVVTAPTPQPVEPPPAGARHGVRVGAGAGFRPTQHDPWLGLTLERTEPWGLVLRLTASTTWSNGTAITVRELSPRLGAGWTFPLDDAFSFTVAIEGGAWLHDWALVSEASVPTGSRVDAVVGLPIEFAYRHATGVQVVAQVWPAWLSSGREHRVGDVVAWSRGPLGLSAALFVGWSG